MYHDDGKMKWTWKSRPNRDIPLLSELFYLWKQWNVQNCANSTLWTSYKLWNY